MNDCYFEPNWDAPEKIKAISTTRLGGVSLTPFTSLNLGMHVQDDKACVEKNRALIQSKASLPSKPLWLNQVHSSTIINSEEYQDNITADGITTSKPSQVLTILTADCLPILLCDEKGKHIAALHAGWRGLANGIISECIKQMPCEPSTIMAWLGPCISAEVFEVGREVYEFFLNFDNNIEQAFCQKNKNKYLANLHLLAKLQLNKLGIHNIAVCNTCTYHNENAFFSYRRDGQTGRMATMIWITNH